MEKSPRSAINQMCGRSGSRFYKKSKRRVDLMMVYASFLLRGLPERHMDTGRKSCHFYGTDVGLQFSYKVATRKLF